MNTPTYYTAPGVPSVRRLPVPERLNIIQSVASSYYKVNPKRVTRERPFVMCRQICYLLMKKHTNVSLKEIGERFNQDHTTVIHGLRTINNLIETDPDIRSTVTRIEQLYLNSK